MKHIQLFVIGREMYAQYEYVYEYWRVEAWVSRTIHGCIATSPSPHSALAPEALTTLAHHQRAERVRAERHRDAAHLGEACPDGRVGETRIDRLIELGDDRCFVFGRSQPPARQRHAPRPGIPISAAMS
jgi:hypothetical protein